MRIAGIVLIVFGVLALAYGGFAYTQREQIIDVGPIEATVERERRVPLPPILGVASLIGGVLLLMAAGRRP
jgi:uncharacterized membrane protein YidH (DUF202 family)